MQRLVRVFTDENPRNPEQSGTDNVLRPKSSEGSASYANIYILEQWNNSVSVMSKRSQIVRNHPGTIGFYPRSRSPPSDSSSFPYRFVAPKVCQRPHPSDSASPQANGKVCEKSVPCTLCSLSAMGNAFRNSYPASHNGGGRYPVRNAVLFQGKSCATASAGHNGRPETATQWMV